MRLPRMKALAGFFLAAVLSAPAWAAKIALPGTINYVEGQVSVGEQALGSKSVGSTELRAGDYIHTRNGMAEVLLTPGIFLRLGGNTSVKMISPSLANTEVQLAAGHAMLEADQLHKANDIRIDQQGAGIRILKAGLYDFDAEQGRFSVFKGRALLQQGDRQVKVKGGHQISLNSGGKLNAHDFKKKAYEGDLYRFSRLRSDYLAEANAQAVVYVANGWAAAPGWWWNPWFGGYTFIPAGGPFSSPFGWWFYSPVGAYPYWGWGPCWGWAGPHHYPHLSAAPPIVRP